MISKSLADRWAVSLPGGHLTMSADILVVTTDATSLQWVKAKDAAKYLKMHKTALQPCHVISGGGGVVTGVTGESQLQGDLRAAGSALRVDCSGGHVTLQDAELYTLYLCPFPSLDIDVRCNQWGKFGKECTGLLCTIFASFCEFILVSE